jgi:NAD-dependent deacetylase
MRVLVLTGAGVSAESGIPTFRGKNGYWKNLDPAKLATPEAFARDPELVWEWYRERRQRIRSARPNAAHATIAKLAQHTDDFLLVTQNVDDLHARAGVPAKKMVQIHGDIFVTRCSRCEFAKHDQPSQGYNVGGEHEGEEQDAAYGVREHVRAFKTATCRRTPKCPECNAPMRPGVVWFGEQLPWNELQRIENFLDRGACDVVIVAGTTATFGYIIDWAVRASSGESAVERAVSSTPFQGNRRARQCAPYRLIEVNPEETPLSRFATMLIREPAAIALPRIVDELIRNR